MASNLYRHGSLSAFANVAFSFAMYLRFAGFVLEGIACHAEVRDLTSASLQGDKVHLSCLLGWQGRCDGSSGFVTRQVGSCEVTFAPKKMKQVAT